MRERIDRGSKWLIEHHGNSVLRLGGVGRIRSWRAVPPELLHPKESPDGLLEVFLDDRTDPDLFLIEVATYPERRVPDQMMRDVFAVVLDRHVVPEVLTLVLRPKGALRISGMHDLSSRLGLTRQLLSWRVVELWTVPAAQLLAANDVGLIPWVPLAHIDGPVEPVFQECRRRIEEQAPEVEQANLLAVVQVMAQLRYNEPHLLALLGGRQVMIESPLIQEIVAEAEAKAEAKGQVRARHKDILRILSKRFAAVPPEMVALLNQIQDETKLDELFDWAIDCTDLNAFRSRLASQ